MNVTVETITPLQAAEWLAQNDHNRSLKSTVVDRLAGAITRGEWSLNGESIKLNGSRLLDGQHRLAAIVQADRAIQTVVVRDVENEAQETIDLGTRRSLGDILELRGETDAKTLASALVQLFLWERTRRIGRLWSAAYPTPQQALALLKDQPAIRNSLPIGTAVKNRLRYPRSLGVALHYLFAQIDKADADDFWDRFANGVRLEDGDPITLLRRYIQDESGHKAKAPDREKMAAFTVKAWNAYRKGERIKRLRYMPGGKSPEPFPVPR